MNEFLFSEIYVGLEQSFTVEIDDLKFENFLKISQDTNPLHVDEDYAISKGFKSKVMHGLLTSAFYSTLVGVYLPGKYALLQGIDIAFSKSVYIGDKLKVYGQVRYINDVYKQIEIKAYIMNQDMLKISRAIIKVGINDE